MVDDSAVKAVLDALDPDEVLTYARPLLAAPSENPHGERVGRDRRARGRRADLRAGLRALPWGMNPPTVGW